MLDERKERIARNETSFREINERLSKGLRQVPDNPDLLEFICECGHRECHEHIELSLQEYEAVRGDARHFAVVPGHVIEDAETVISSRDRYEVVEKGEEAVAFVDDADSRIPGAEGSRDDPA